MMKPYLDAAATGKNDWWRYVISFGLIFMFWFGFGSIPLIMLAIFMELDNNPATFINTATTAFEGIPPLVFFLVTMFSFLTLMVALFIAVKFIHARPFRSLVNPALRVNWGRFFQSAGLWFVLAGIVAIIEALLHPGRYSVTFDLRAFIPILIAALILTPIQTSAEELLLRGYLMQSLGLRIRNAIFLSAISAFVFMVLHFGNPEMNSNAILMALFYFSFGFFAAFITLKDGSLELALGMHAANNLFSGLVANYAMSALPTPSIFMVNELDAPFGLVSSVLTMIVFYIIIFKPWQKASEVTHETG